MTVHVKDPAEVAALLQALQHVPMRAKVTFEWPGPMAREVTRTELRKADVLALADALAEARDAVSQLAQVRRDLALAQQSLRDASGPRF